MDLVVAALLVGLFEYPALDVGHYSSVIDDIADTLRQRLMKWDSGAIAPTTTIQETPS
jgi:hypothetical protein